MTDVLTAKSREVLGEVKRRFGIGFSETYTGGGCCALEARLESGHWIVATDEGLCSFRERLTFEADADADGGRRALGWAIGIYEHEEWMDGDEAVLFVTDFDAFADALPDLVGRALAELAESR